MRIAVLVAAAAVVGLIAHADGVARKAVTSPELDKLTASESSMSTATAPGHERYSYRHGATYAVEAGSTALACEAACGEDAVCQAWSFVETYGKDAARCELKRGGGKPEENLLATSGVSPRIDEAYWGVVLEDAPPPTDTLAGEPEVVAAEVAGN